MYIYIYIYLVCIRTAFFTNDCFFLCQEETCVYAKITTLICFEN